MDFIETLALIAVENTFSLFATATTDTDSDLLTPEQLAHQTRKSLFDQGEPLAPCDRMLNSIHFALNEKNSITHIPDTHRAFTRFVKLFVLATSTQPSMDGSLFLRYFRALHNWDFTRASSLTDKIMNPQAYILPDNFTPPHLSPPPGLEDISPPLSPATIPTLPDSPPQSPSPISRSSAISPSAAITRGDITLHLV